MRSKPIDRPPLVVPLVKLVQSLQQSNDLLVDTHRGLVNEAVFGKSGRKMVENPISEENPTQKETPEAVELQEFKLGSGGPVCRSDSGDPE